MMKYIGFLLFLLLAACAPAAPSESALEPTGLDGPAVLLAPFTREPTLTPTATLTWSPTDTSGPVATSTPVPAAGETLLSLHACVPAGPWEMGMVVNVVDGVTVDVEIDGQIYKVRYLGIEAKEFTASGEEFGSQAAARNGELVAGQMVTLVKDGSETDREGRLLRYVFAGDLFVNLELVQEGYAQATDSSLNVACGKEFVKAEMSAMLANSILGRVTPDTPMLLIPTFPPTKEPLEESVPCSCPKKGSAR